jgi:hypothetical protein
MFTFLRIFLCETDALEQPLSTQFPDVDNRLPSEAESLNRKAAYSKESLSNQLTTGPGSLTAVGIFGQEAQAGYLLDRVINIVRNRTLVIQSSDISILDRDLREFLRICMNKDWGVAGSECGPMGIAIR